MLYTSSHPQTHFKSVLLFGTTKGERLQQLKTALLDASATETMEAGYRQIYDTLKGIERDVPPFERMSLPTWENLIQRRDLIAVENRTDLKLILTGKHAIILQESGAYQIRNTTSVDCLDRSSTLKYSHNLARLDLLVNKPNALKQTIALN